MAADSPARRIGARVKWAQRSVLRDVQANHPGEVTSQEPASGQRHWAPGVMTLEDLGLAQQMIFLGARLNQPHEARIIQREDHTVSQQEWTKAKLLARIAGPHRLAVQGQADELLISTHAVKIVTLDDGRVLGGTEYFRSQ